MKKSERVRLFLDRLKAAEPCADHDEAYDLIAVILNAVEDEHSGVPPNPATWESDGRLYPPQADRASLPAGFSGVVRYRSLGHWTYVAPNGAFRIKEIASREVLIDCVGRDGRGVQAFAVRT
jgi:hypothetical protein